jgi:hypothetical protein
MLRVPNKLLFHHTCISGATLGKGFYRGIGTVLGGGLGCIAAILGEQVGGIGNPFIVGVSLFIFGNVFIIPRIQYQQKKNSNSNQQSIKERREEYCSDNHCFFFSLTMKFLRPIQFEYNFFLLLPNSHLNYFETDRSILTVDQAGQQHMLD